MKTSVKLAILLTVMAFGSAGSGHAQQAAKSKAGPRSAQTTAPAAAPQAEAAPAGPTAASPGWAARCTSASRDAPLECAIEQTAILTKTGQLVVLVNIRVPSDTPTPVALVQLPLGINLPAGAKLQVDDAKAVDLQIQTCENRGCYAARAGRADGAAIGQAVESVVPESGQGNDHHPDAADRFRRRLRQDQVVGFRHCERSEAIQNCNQELDCFVALLLAMTEIYGYCRAICALPMPSPSSFWSSCIATVTRDSRPLNSNGAS